MNTNNKLNKANSYRLSQELLRNKALKKGVTLVAPETTFLSKDTLFGKNVIIDPYVVIGPRVKIGDNSHIKSFSHLEGTKIEKNVTVGPYARLREGTVLKKNTKIGNFVETKKSSINQNSKVNHLSYIGDTSIGKHSRSRNLRGGRCALWRNKGSRHGAHRKGRKKTTSIRTCTGSCEDTRTHCWTLLCQRPPGNAW